MIKFAIITQQRSGSNLLRSFLNQHPDIYCYGEMFSPSGTVKDNFFKDKDLIVKRAFYHKEQNKNIEDYLSHLFNSAKKYNAVGIDLKYNQMNDEIVSYLVDKSVRVIHLIRRDLLATWLSDYLVDGKRHEKLPRKIDPKKIKKQMRFTKHSINKYRNIGFKKYLSFSYEEMTNDKNINKLPKKLEKQILDFVGVDYLELESKVIEKNKWDYENMIINYEELKRIEI
jgi:ribosomal protein L22